MIYKHKHNPLYIDLVLVVFDIIYFVFACYIYLSCRTEDMLIYSWLNIDTSSNFISFIREHSIILPNWVKYNLPDALWLLSYLLLIDWMWGKAHQMKLFFQVPVILFAFILEYLQYMGWFYGTGDIIDIAFYIISILIYIIIYKIKFLLYENFY